jgi:hypothetical protein
MRYVIAGAAVLLLAACTPQAESKPQDNKPVEHPTWGKRYTWKDGLAVEVAAPVECKPGEFASPQNIKRAVKFKVTVANGTQKQVEAALLTIGGDAQFAGAKADTVFDSSGGCGSGGLESGTILPGKTYTYEVAYSVGAEKGEMQLSFVPHLDKDSAVFVGQA